MPGLQVSAFGVSGNTGYFSGSLDGGSPSLWRTDGTAAGTTQVTQAGVTVDPAAFIPLGNGLTLFTNLVQNGAPQLWSTDGTASGTHQIVTTATAASPPYCGVQEFDGVSIGQKGIFIAADSSGNDGIWSTDGTAAGTLER